jgi:hypothetical protein
LYFYSINSEILGIGDFGLGIGDFGLGISDFGLGISDFGLGIGGWANNEPSLNLVNPDLDRIATSVRKFTEVKSQFAPP